MNRRRASIMLNTPPVVLHTLQSKEKPSILNEFVGLSKAMPPRVHLLTLRVKKKKKKKKKSLIY